MRVKQDLDRAKLVSAAMGQIPCDLSVENVKLVNLITGEIYPAAVDVLDGVIVRVREKGRAAEQKKFCRYNSKTGRPRARNTMSRIHRMDAPKKIHTTPSTMPAVVFLQMR